MLIAQPAVEALDERIVHGFARPAEDQPGAVLVGHHPCAASRILEHRQDKRPIDGTPVLRSPSARTLRRFAPWHRAELLADRAAHGAEQVRGMLVGNLLAVGPLEVSKVAVLYALVGLGTGSVAARSS